MLIGTGSCLPERTFRNDEFPASLQTSDEWISTRTGIRERRIAGDQETTSRLAIAASQRALKTSGVNAADIDLIVCATVTPDVIVPPVGCRIQKALGCRPIPAFDLNAACTGFVYAVTIAEKFIHGGVRNALVIGADTLTRAVDFSERSSCILFGDGAGAAVLSAAPDDSKRGLHFAQLYSDGSEIITLNGLGARRAPSPTGGSSTSSTSDDYIRLNGREVFKFAVTRVRQLIQEIMRSCELTPTDIDLVIPHQVNQRILDTAFDGIGIPPERVMVNLDRYGNTSAASVPIALDEAMRTGRAKPGDTVVLMAFGGGMTWGGLVLTL